jgi:hypothetical protein
MIRFAKNIFLFLFIIFILDNFFGLVLKKMFYSQSHGDDAVSIELLSKTITDILILGSSRASHHFISDSIQAYTKYTTFNGGRDNCGIHYIESVLPIITNRYSPKCVIIDLMPNNFLCGGQDYQKYFDIQSTILLPFANKYPSIYKDVISYNYSEVIKAKISDSYAYNSLIGSIVQNTYTHLGHIQIKGYEPLYDSIHKKTYPIALSNEDNLNDILDSNALRSLQKSLICLRKKGIKVIITFSPFYFSRPIKPIVFNAIVDICDRNNCKIINFNDDKRFFKNADYFYDELHCNHTGAKVLSKDVSIEILK